MKIHPLLQERNAGVLLHPTSLPSTAAAHGLGDLGPTARRFVDWMASAGLGLWQMLPVGPVGEGDSPYSALSSFALEPMLVSVADLIEDGLLPRSAARGEPGMDDDRGRASWRYARAWKRPRLEAAYERFTRRRGSRGARGSEFATFREHAGPWLTDWCDFATARATGRTARVRPGGPVERRPEFHAFVQFVLDRQWARLRRYALERGVRLVGDLPIFCGADSADVQGRPDLFRLDRAGRPTALTGCPPDAFARDGQLWGHPHYRWAAHRRESFRWWRARVTTTLERFDLLRVDHFIGFVRAYEVPGDAKNARHGRWGRTPGRELLDLLRKDLGTLPFIAEDLGDVTPAVHRLRDECGLPGMRILQWAFHDSEGRSRDLPHHHPHHSVVYPGTHDNDTIAGWWRAQPAAVRGRFAAYAGPGARSDPAESMIRLALTSPANTAIVQMQDLLGLGRSARMNIPGQARGNWTWRLRRAEPSRRLAAAIRRLTTASGRHAV
ncbi:MAG: 4-alpha-glucanotransferase [Planctomycetota bacterium]|nr:4-alpha-glucanotransferase [Planctomycetota bacterium]